MQRNRGSGNSNPVLALPLFGGAARAVRCAVAIRDGVKNLGMNARCGLHSGEVELRGDDIGGIAVIAAARVAAIAARDEVVVSQTVKDLTLGAGIEFADRGRHTLKGIPGEWPIHLVEA